MEDKPESELTAWLESELRQISNLKAPPTLAPRVMRLIQARSRSAWWRQPFWDWSFQARAAFIGVLVAGVAFLVWAG
ncbi:MAG: hypothetical protein M1608_09100, partial [Candidatus Omnitrophica bacterium]|nr:hypothetical protein [Candidatus Omnitrophota bacterium]